MQIMNVHNYFVHAYLELFQVIVACSATVPEVIHYVTTPLCQLLHDFGFSCLHRDMYTTGTV